MKHAIADRGLEASQNAPNDESGLEHGCWCCALNSMGPKGLIPVPLVSPWIVDYREKSTIFPVVN